MKATLLIQERRVHADGHVVEVVLWHVPSPVPPSEYAFKYRMVLVKDGERLVGYDNERGKGDHRHILGREEAYAFTTIARLLDDFETSVVAVEGGAI